MTIGDIGGMSGIASFVGMLCYWAFKFYEKRAEADRADADREKKRIEDRDKTQAEHADWLRDTVEAQIVEAKADRMRERAECTARIDDLEDKLTKSKGAVDELTRQVRRLQDALSDVPDMVERLVIAIFRINPNTTPTAAQLSEIRQRATDLGLTPAAANGLVLVRGQSA